MSTYADRIRTKTAIKIRKTITSGTKIKSRNELKGGKDMHFAKVWAPFCSVLPAGRFDPILNRQIRMGFKIPIGRQYEFRSRHFGDGLPYAGDEDRAGSD
jgi:hypothetical protein